MEEFLTVLDGADVVTLGTVGRVTGRETTRPVWFVRRDGSLYLLPVNGSASQWYRNVLRTPTMHLAADGAEFEVRGRAITDPDAVEQIMDDFRGKYGAEDVDKYYAETEVAVEAPLDESQLF